MFGIYARRKDAEQNLLSEGYHASLESPDHGPASLAS